MTGGELHDLVAGPYLVGLAPLGFPRYTLDRAGRLWSHWGDKPRQLVPTMVHGTGYHKVTLVNGDVKRTWLLHTLMLLAFVGPKADPAHEARHLDGDRTNNTIGNLAWGTRAENAADRESHGTTIRGEKHYRAKITAGTAVAIRTAAASGEGHRALARRFGISKTQIGRIATRKSWAHI